MNATMPSGEMPAASGVTRGSRPGRIVVAEEQSPIMQAVPPRTRLLSRVRRVGDVWSKVTKGFLSGVRVQVSYFIRQLVTYLQPKQIPCGTASLAFDVILSMLPRLRGCMRKKQAYRHSERSEESAFVHPI